ncbi:MAG TPA: GNAT family protein [Nitrolancea sp.]|nr:GNAT family protein [Nitrolancea sp.]
MDRRLAARQLSGADVFPLPPGLDPARTTLDGRYTRLEPLEPREHAKQLWDACRTGEDTDRTWDFMGYGPFPNFSVFQGWLRDNAAVADPTFYIIRDGRDGRAAGMASFLNIHPKDGVIEIGHIWLAQSLRNSREATEALYLMMSYAMDDLGYRRLEWKCDARNSPSRNAAARLGFAYEGTFYQHFIVKGHNRDTAWFSILDSEWPAIRSNFETWLAPENFDAQGAQVQSLGDLNRALRAG